MAVPGLRSRTRVAADLEVRLDLVGVDGPAGLVVAQDGEDGLAALGVAVEHGTLHVRQAVAVAGRRQGDLAVLGLGAVGHGRREVLGVLAGDEDGAVLHRGRDALDLRAGVALVEGPPRGIVALAGEDFVDLGQGGTHDLVVADGRGHHEGDLVVVGVGQQADLERAAVVALRHRDLREGVGQAVLLVDLAERVARVVHVDVAVGAAGGAQGQDAVDPRALDRPALLVERRLEQAHRDERHGLVIEALARGGVVVEAPAGHGLGQEVKRRAADDLLGHEVRRTVLGDQDVGVDVGRVDLDRELDRVTALAGDVHGAELAGVAAEVLDELVGEVPDVHDEMLVRHEVAANEHQGGGPGDGARRGAGAGGGDGGRRFHLGVPHSVWQFSLRVRTIPSALASSPYPRFCRFSGSGP